ncbi:MAG TPA: biotin/lipoyl-containing protein, partial [Candidatus Dormibacteraeota bacterium]|nr:biotin/lipoyl-containing protein [Candidatus Dormibacteraeota bacterium]
MAHPILMPMPGQMTEECTVVAWHKREGDEVRKGDVLFEIETDKSNMDVEAFDEGVVLRILVHDGQTVPVNTVCGYVGEPGEAVPAPRRGDGMETLRVAMPATEILAGAGGRIPRGPGSLAAEPPGGAAPPRRRRTPISPRAARVAAELAVDPSAVVGTGPGGRIVERDVLAAADAAARAATSTSERKASIEPSPEPAPPTLAIEADALELAARELVASLGIRGTGPDGYVTREDIELAVREQPRPLSRMRQVIAQRLTDSFTSTPHFAVTVAVDMTALLGVRDELRRGGADYSVT